MTADGEVDDVQHHLGGPGHAEDQSDDGEGRVVEVERADDGKAPEGHLEEADDEHEVGWVVEAWEFGCGEGGQVEDPGSEDGAAVDPAGVQSGADGKPMRAMPRPMVGVREKQRRRRMAAIVKPKVDQSTKWTITSGHNQTAFCQAKARAMASIVEPSMGGSQNLSTRCSFRMVSSSSSPAATSSSPSSLSRSMAAVSATSFRAFSFSLRLCSVGAHRSMEVRNYWTGEGRRKGREEGDLRRRNIRPGAGGNFPFGACGEN